MRMSLLKEAVTRCLQNKLVPFVTASPGTGKSSLAQEIANENNLELIDFRLSYKESVDLGGLPSKTDTGKFEYLPMDEIPIVGDEIPQGKDGWLLFLDEFNSADLGVQKASYQLVLDRALGKHKLHPNVVCMAAGNLTTDKAIVNKLSTAMQSRLVHLELTATKDEWMEWANTAGIDFRVKSFIDFKPTLLHHFDPNHDDKTFPCQRTWEFVSKLIKGTKELSLVDRELLVGTVGQAAATEFYTFCKVYKQLPKITDIVAAPTKTKIPEEPSTQYAITGHIAEHVRKDNIEKVMEYVSRLPVEFQVLTVKQIMPKNPTWVNLPWFVKWRDKNAVHLMGA